jgi:putative tryptophan/tyrosine transport system substrate-binding protein
MYGTRDFADAGGLITFGASATDQWRRAAVYVDKVLKGPGPPLSLLQRADHVIQ